LFSCSFGHSRDLRQHRLDRRLDARVAAEMAWSLSGEGFRGHALSDFASNRSGRPSDEHSRHFRSTTAIFIAVIFGLRPGGAATL
jgi:hypothetical protein